MITNTIESARNLSNRLIWNGFHHSSGVFHWKFKWNPCRWAEASSNYDWLFSFCRMGKKPDTGISIKPFICFEILIWICKFWLRAGNNGCNFNWRQLLLIGALRGALCWPKETLTIRNVPLIILPTLETTPETTQPLNIPQASSQHPNYPFIAAP